MHRRHHAIPLLQAAREAPTLARLTELARDSGERLRQIEPLLPPGLRATVKPGPIDGENWCLLVDSSSAAAKLRQLLPALMAHLRSKGWAVQTIRLKVQGRRA
ncbi:DciA family protein [Xylophilus sp. ASV27]|uniref:DciA family protein n=1 Tax=Xylophilus sp. ASV27 TaxID=2795129 RepID=UPI0018EB73C8|nr:DciA family protein [Xylophilus sp. ASV27]